MRNTLGKEQVPQDVGRPKSDEALREYCDKNYHQILIIIAEKVHQEKVQQEKLKAVKARLNFKEASQHSESGTLSRRMDLKERLRPRHARSVSGILEPRRGHFESPRERGVGHTMAAIETLKAATRALAPEKQNLLLRNIITKEHPHKKRKRCQKVKVAHEDIGNQNQRGKSRVLRTTCPNHRKPFLKNYLQYKKCIKDPVEIHNIKQRDGESTEEFVRRYKLECRDVKGAPEYMKISRFMHKITNPELIKRLHDKIPKSLDEMMRVTTAFLIGGVMSSSRERKKSFPSWK
ncbi:hypothetical protein Tco_0255584 [Tanacetum coccineum]